MRWIWIFQKKTKENVEMKGYLKKERSLPLLGKKGRNELEWMEDGSCLPRGWVDGQQYRGTNRLGPGQLLRLRGQVGGLQCLAKLSWGWTTFLRRPDSCSYFYLTVVTNNHLVLRLPKLMQIFLVGKFLSIIFIPGTLKITLHWWYNFSFTIILWGR